MEAALPGLIEPAAPARRIIWVERLALLDLLLLLAESALRGSEIRYDEHKATGAARAVLSFLGGLGLAGRLLPARLTLAVREASGKALNYRMEAELHGYVRSLRGRYFPDRPQWFSDMAECWLSSHLFFRVTFLVMVEHAARELPGAKHELYLTRHPANEQILREDRRPGLRLRQSLSLLGHAALLFGPLWLLLRCAFAAFFGSRAPRPRRQARPSIWIEYYPLDLDSWISRAFWRDEVRREGFDLVFYLDRSDTPWTEETARLIRSRGFVAADCHQAPLLSRLSPGELRALCKRLLSPGDARPLWIRLFELEFEVLVRMWASIFLRFKVRLLVQHQEFSWKQMAQARALEEAGGTMMGFHWSYFPYLEEPGHLSPQQVFFVWGEAGREWLEGKGHDCRHILPCGVWIPPNREPEELRKGLAPGLRFTLAIFDSSYAYNIYLSEKDLSDFLDSVLALAEKHRDWAVILKPKVQAEYRHLPAGRSIHGRMERLSQQGRLAVVGREVSPASAAAAADLSACFGFNSAGVIAGALGRRAVHWDCSGWLEHPFYAKAGQQIVFGSLEELGEAVIRAAGGDPAIGDFSQWRRWMNHFDDDAAAERVGAFIQDYMDAVLAATPAAQALEEAARSYRKRWELAADPRAELTGPGSPAIMFKP